MNKIEYIRKLQDIISSLDEYYIEDPMMLNLCNKRLNVYCNISTDAVVLDDESLIENSISLSPIDYDKIDYIGDPIKLYYKLEFDLGKDVLNYILIMNNLEKSPF